jgi:hypothetical protein
MPGIARRVVLDQIEVKPDGTVFVQLDKQVADGDEILMHEPHRFPMLPGIDLDRQVDAVNNGLASLGWPRMDQSAVERVRRVVRLEHTPAVRKAYRERVKAEQKAMREEEERQAALLVSASRISGRGDEGAVQGTAPPTTNHEVDVVGGAEPGDQ